MGDRPVTDKIQVLLVEDDNIDAKTVSRGLADSTRPVFHVDRVSCLSDALERLNNEIAVDVVLLDLGLPDSTGINTVMPLIELDNSPPIVVFTGQDNDDLVDKLLSLGVQDYVVKGTETKEQLQRCARFAVERHRLMERVMAEQQENMELMDSVSSEDVDAILDCDFSYKHQYVESQKENQWLIGEAQRANDELRQFAYLASHELQSPLRAVVGHCELLERKHKTQLSDEAIDHLHFASGGAHKMQLLLDSLLEYSRVQSIDRLIEDVEGELILKKAMTLLQESIDKSGAQINSKDLPSFLADSEQMVRLFRNLLDNAITFADGQTPQIDVTAEQKSDQWIFSIRDNGIGIEPKFFDRIFDLFQRLHRQDEYPGSGMGLSICRKIVELHNGRIWVESALGEGSTFHFTIPREIEEPQ